MTNRGHLIEEPLPSETTEQACQRIAEKYGRILSLREIEDICFTDRHESEDARAWLVDNCPDLPDVGHGRKKDAFDKARGNKGYKKRSCLRCGSNFDSSGAGNRICGDCKLSQDRGSCYEW